MKIYTLFFLFLLLIPFHFIYSQEDTDLKTGGESVIFNFFEQDTRTAIPDAIDAESLLYEKDAVFIIDSFSFHITGITRQFALLDKGDINKGDEITGYSSLVKYVQDKQQLLYNQRALQSAVIEFTVGSRKADGKYPVELIITTKDSWNIIALPRPNYSTNSGIKITLNVRDYNFLGTLMPLRFDIGYRHDLEGRNYYSFMLDTNTPFRFLGLGWNFIFNNDLEYRPHLDEPFYYKNTTGLSVNLPLGKTVFVMGLRESLFLNQEYDDAEKEHYGDTHKGLYLTTNPFIDWIIPAGIEAGRYGHVYYVPSVSAVIPHSLSPWPLTTECESGHIHDLKAFPSLHFGHSLGFGRIDWKNNFKSGLSVNISNSYGYYFRNKQYDARPWESYIQLNVTSHNIIFNNVFGFSSRLLYRHWLFSSVHEKAGDVMRGIPDDNIHANLMISLSMDFPVKVMTFKPADWFGVDFFKFFHFDFILSPVADISLFHHPVHQTSLNFNNFLFSGGLEAIAYPHIIRSLHLRVAFYVNLSRGDQSPNTINAGYNPSTAGKYEIYIGTDFHF